MKCQVYNLLLKIYREDLSGGPVVKNFPANAENMDWILGPGEIPHAMEQLCPWATTTEASVPRACVPQRERPPQWEAHTPQLERGPHSLQLEKSHKDDPV